MDFTRPISDLHHHKFFIRKFFGEDRTLKIFKARLKKLKKLNLKELQPINYLSKQNR